MAFLIPRDQLGATQLVTQALESFGGKTAKGKPGGRESRARRCGIARADKGCRTGRGAGGPSATKERAGSERLTPGKVGPGGVRRRAASGEKE